MNFLGGKMAKHKRRVKRKLNIKRILVLLAIIIFITVVIKNNLIYKTILAFNPITIQNLNINISKNEIEPGEEIEISTIISPENYSQSNLEWYVSDTNIVEVSDGKIIGKSEGKAKIYLTNNEIKSNEIEVECLIKIKDLSIDNLIEEMKLGDTYKLETKILPEDATYQELDYESSNTDIIEVDKDGNLKANNVR